MKIKTLVADITAVESPDIAERAILKMILAGRFFLPLHTIFVVREPFCDTGTPS